MHRTRPALFKPELKVLPPYEPSGKVCINPQMLVLARRVRGVKVGKVASYTGISIHRIKRMEQGKLEPTHEELAVLAWAFEYPEEFFFQEGKIEPLSSYSSGAPWDEDCDEPKR